MHVFDVDGTWLPYDGYKQYCGKINDRLLYGLLKEGICQIGIATNQGGIPMGEMGWQRQDSGLVYPTVDLFLQRLDYLDTQLRAWGIRVARVRVSLYHPKTVGLERVQDVACCIRETAMLAANQIPDWKVFTEEGYRKPAPGMLVDAGATVYYGDSIEDKQAAQSAGIPFIEVPRFV